MSSSALILTPAAPGSLGDEAMVLASVDYLKRKGIKNIALINHKKNKKYPGDEITNISLEGFFEYQSWSKFLVSFFEAGWQINQYERLYCIGADIMDGYYSNFVTFKMVKIVELASFLGLSTTILGFSYNEKPTNLSKQLLSALPPKVKLCARDKISYQRLVDSVSHSINLAADVAFLLQPIEQSKAVDQVLAWIDSQKRQQKIIVGINIHPLLFYRLEGITADDMVQVMVNTLKELYQSNQQLSFIFLPHDRRMISGVSDDTLSTRVMKCLPPDIMSSSFKIPFPCFSREIKAIVKHIDCVITGRMHLGIACLGQGTPIACITYQGKFEGLYQHFDLKPLFIEPQELFTHENSLVDLANQLIAQRDSSRQQIEHKLPEVKKLSQANFETII